MLIVSEFGYIWLFYEYSQSHVEGCRKTIASMKRIWFVFKKTIFEFAFFYSTYKIASPFGDLNYNKYKWAKLVGNESGHL